MTNKSVKRSPRDRDERRKPGQHPYKQQPVRAAAAGRSPGPPTSGSRCSTAGPLEPSATSWFSGTR